MLFLAVAVACVGFALSMQTAVNSNFVADTLKLTAADQGMIEASRESCGILALAILALMAGFAEPLIALAMLVLVAAGLMLTSWVPPLAVGTLMGANFLWSQGLHVWMPLPQSMAIGLAERGHEGRKLGSLGSAGAIGSAVALVLAWGLNRAGVTVRPMFVIATGAALVGALACLGIPRNIKVPGQKIVLRRKYALYYLLCFLEGWRKQIFIAFAGYLLVKEYHTPLSTMLLLFLVAQVVGWFSSPLTGRIIDRFGERPVLLTYYIAMAVVFVGYAMVPNSGILCGLFVADSVLFVCTMAQTTYVTRLAPPEEHTGTLSAGVAANHIASVSMPLIGGLLWQKWGFQWAFCAGAIMAVLTVIPVLWIPSRRR